MINDFPKYSATIQLREIYVKFSNVTHSLHLKKKKKKKPWCMSNPKMAKTDKQYINNNFFFLQHRSHTKNKPEIERRQNIREKI